MALMRKGIAMTDIDVANEMISALKNWVEAEVIPNASDFELPDEYPTDLSLIHI